MPPKVVKQQCAFVDLQGQCGTPEKLPRGLLFPYCQKHGGGPRCEAGDACVSKSPTKHPASLRFGANGVGSLCCQCLDLKVEQSKREAREASLEAEMAKMQLADVASSSTSPPQSKCYCVAGEHWVSASEMWPNLDDCYECCSVKEYAEHTGLSVSEAEAIAKGQEENELEYAALQEVKKWGLSDPTNLDIPRLFGKLRPVLCGQLVTRRLTTADRGLHYRVREGQESADEILWTHNYDDASELVTWGLSWLQTRADLVGLFDPSELAALTFPLIVLHDIDDDDAEEWDYGSGLFFEVCDPQPPYYHYSRVLYGEDAMEAPYRNVTHVVQLYEVPDEESESGSGMLSPFPIAVKLF